MPVPNHEFMGSLRTVLRIPFGIPLPRWILEAGAVLIGTETELVLKSRRVVPSKLMQAGYSFRFAEIRKALLDCA
jgi:NAD dependent epimerase/dehydratase family enzyme